MWYAFIFFIVGSLWGVLATYWYFRTKKVGNLNVYLSDPMEDNFMALELHTDVNEVVRKKTILLTVSIH